MTTVATRAIVGDTIPDSATGTNRRTEAPPLDLEAARERAGISLACIADQTNIPLSLLAGLERGDLRHCPPGIYARGARARGDAVTKEVIRSVLRKTVSLTCRTVKFHPTDAASVSTLRC